MPESYDSHFKRSIPLYQESHLYHKISSYYIKDENINYEIDVQMNYIGGIANIKKFLKN